MTQAPLPIIGRFGIVEALCPCNGDLVAFSCEQWKNLLPCLYQKLAELIPLAGTTIVLGEETHNVDEAIDALRKLVVWIQTEACKTEDPFSELVAPIYDCW